MRLFARLENDVVKELHQTETDIEGKFHAALQFVEVTGQDIKEGFVKTAQGFVKPPEPANTAPPPPTLAELQATLAHLTSQIATLAAKA
jgi:hypothetical protein